MLTHLHLGARVESADGHKLGKIKYLVADSTTKQVTHFIIESEIVDNREKVLEVGRVSQVSQDGKEIRVNLTENDVPHLTDFVDRNYSGAAGEDRPIPVDASDYIYPTSSTVEAGVANVGSSVGFNAPFVGTAEIGRASCRERV